MATVQANMDDLITAVGEVQASPTSNTLLDRLKTLYTTLTDGNQKTQLTGSILAEQLTETDAVANVLTFAANISAIEIYHEEATWQDFTVNGLTLKIPAGYYRSAVGGAASDEVTIPAGISCIVGRLT